MVRTYLEKHKEYILLALVGALLFITLFDRGGLRYSSFLLVAISMLPFGFVVLLHKGSIHDLKYMWGSLLLFLSFFLISFLFSQTSNYGFPSLVLFVAGPLIMFGLARQQFSVKKIRLFLEWLIFLAVTISLLGILFFYTESFNRVAGTFRNFSETYTFFPNALANFLIMIMPLGVYFSLQRGLTTRRFFMSVTVFLFFIFFLTFSRGGFLTLLLQVLAVVLGGIYFIYQHTLQWKRFLTLLLRIGILLAIAFMLAFFALFLKPSSPIEQNTFVEKATLTSNEGVSSVSERVQFWRASLNIIRDNPLFGTGADSFRFVYPRYQTELLAFSDHPHNIFLKLGIEHGIFVVGTFILFLIVAAVSLSKRMPHVKRQKKELVYVMSMSVLGGLLHNMVDYNFNFAANSILWWALLGLIFSCVVRKPGFFSRIRMSFSRRISFWKWIIGGISIFLFVLALHEGYYTIQFRLGTSLLVQGKHQEALVQFSRAEALFFERNLYNDQALAYKLLYEQNRDEQWLSQARYALTQELAINKYDAFAWNMLASIEPDALLRERYALYALELDARNHLSYYDFLTRLYLEQNRKKELEYWFPIIDTLLNEYLTKLAVNSHLTILTDNPKAALRLCAVMLYLVRGDEFVTEYQDRCLEIERVFLLEAAKFEQAYGFTVDAAFLPSISFMPDSL